MPNELVLEISTEGNMRFIYDDSLVELLNEGDATIERASHVEPEGTEWVADMAPVATKLKNEGSPLVQTELRLGPFKTRQEALDAETEWLNKQLYGL